MNKGQVVGLLLAGAAAGVGGRQIVEGIVDNAVPAASAKPTVPYVHAADLRRDVTDAGVPVRFTVYGTGVRDLGQAKKCTEKPATQKKAVELLNALSADCAW